NLWQGKKNPHPQEIIEFPSVIVSSVIGQLEACFQTYSPLARRALLRHDKWLEKKGIKNTNFAVVTWSNWDCRVMLESEPPIQEDQGAPISTDGSFSWKQSLDQHPILPPNHPYMLKELALPIFPVSPFSSPTFVNRFIEALFYYSAYFDCLETCWDHNIEHRLSIEANFSRGIKHIVAMEGADRIAR
ncbi:hypothetical protein Tsubulata_008813, partial [Turnera subulata]